MRVPVWITLGVALLVCVFGAYRIRLAFRSDEEDQRARAKKGLYAMGRRTHFLIGVVYLLLGAGLVATTFGWNPFGGMFGQRTEAPSQPSAPTKTGSASTDPPPPPPSAPESKSTGEPTQPSK